MSKTKTLLPENITKTFRKFNGDLNMQINNEKWIILSADNNEVEDLDSLVLSRNLGTLDNVTLDENLSIVKITIDPYKNANKKVLEEVRKIYRHG